MSQSTDQKRDLLLVQLNELQASKLTLLQTASQEMEKLRSFIKVLGQIDKEKQNITSKSLQEIENFHLSSNPKDIQNQQDNLLKLYNEQYSSLNIIKLQQEIKILQESKLELIITINTEINNMRDSIKLLIHSISHQNKYSEKDLFDEFEAKWNFYAEKENYKTFFGYTQYKVLNVKLFLNALGHSKLINQLLAVLILDKAQTKLLIVGFAESRISNDIVNVISQFIDEIVMIDGRKNVDIPEVDEMYNDDDDLAKQDVVRNKIDKLLSLRALDLLCEWYGDSGSGTMTVNKKSAINAMKKLLKKQQPLLTEEYDKKKYVHVSIWWAYWRRYNYFDKQIGDKMREKI